MSGRSFVQLVVALLVGLISKQSAAATKPTCDPLVDSGHAAFARCHIVEWDCGPGLCTSDSFLISSVPTKYTQADLILDDWDMSFTGGSFNPNEAKLNLVKVSYTGGTFTGRVEGMLAEPTGTATERHQIYFYVLFADNTDSSIKTKSYSCTSAPASGGSCSSSLTTASWIPTGFTLEGFGVRSVDFIVDSGNGIPLHGYGFDFSGYSQSGANLTFAAAKSNFLSTTTSTETYSATATLVGFLGDATSISQVGTANLSSTIQVGLNNTTAPTTPTGTPNGVFGMVDKNITASTNTSKTWSLGEIEGGSFATSYPGPINPLKIETLWGVNFPSSSTFQYTVQTHVAQIVLK